MDRYWLLTNTCYGCWLPGDARGFVGHVWEHRAEEDEEDARVVHDVSGTEFDKGMIGLQQAAVERMIGPPIQLEIAHAVVSLEQFRETARFRRWSILAAAIMHNHFHLVVGVPGDPKPGKILGDFKSWGTHALTQRFGEPASENWWTELGAKRKLPNELAVCGAIEYVLYKQPNPLVTRSPDAGT